MLIRTTLLFRNNFVALQGQRLVLEFDTTLKASCLREGMLECLECTIYHIKENAE